MSKQAIEMQQTPAGQSFAFRWRGRWYRIASFAVKKLDQPLGWHALSKLRKREPNNIKVLSFCTYQQRTNQFNRQYAHQGIIKSSGSCQLLNQTRTAIYKCGLLRNAPALPLCAGPSRFTV
jgi:hypothetical protein